MLKVEAVEFGKLRDALRDETHEFRSARQIHRGPLVEFLDERQKKVFEHLHIVGIDERHAFAFDRVGEKLDRLLQTARGFGHLRCHEEEDSLRSKVAVKKRQQIGGRLLRYEAKMSVRSGNGHVESLKKKMGVKATTSLNSEKIKLLCS